MGDRERDYSSQPRDLPQQSLPDSPPDSPIRRLSADDSDQLSAVLGENFKAFVSVQIKFLDVPVAGLKLTIENADGVVQVPEQAWATQMKWNANSPNMTTDDQGRCTLGKLVPIGNYICKIEHQPDAPITTVEDVGRPFILVLPIGRPYSDFYVFPQE
jgi:hypothetical protein